jgi:hypothetical protein
VRWAEKVSDRTVWGRAVVQATSGAREMALVLGVVLLLVVGRSAVFVLFEQAQFDADQAVMGLMAKHIAQGRAFPFYQYAQSYVMVVEAWLAAPSLALFGLSVASLRLPLVLLNVAAGWLLVVLLVRELKLRPLMALVPTLLFAAAPPVLAAELVTALGGNIEPFVYVLLLWLCRSRPVLFGVIFVVGFLNREFTAYAVTSLLAVEVLQRRLWQRDNLRQKALAALVAVVVWQLAGLVRVHADAMGPGTAGMRLPQVTTNASVAIGFICPDVDPVRIGTNLASLVTTQLGTLLGTAPFRLIEANIASPTSQGAPGFWPIFAALLVVLTMRVTSFSWRALVTERRASTEGTGGVRPSAESSAGFGIYLVLIGVQSGVAWAVSRCGDLDPMTLRYALLAVLAPIGVIALHLAEEKRQWWRSLTIGMVMIWVAVSMRAHVELARYYLSDPGPSEYRRLADELVARDLRYVKTDYWAAYMISFLTDERVTATPVTFMRVIEYDREVANHADRAIFVSRKPCEGGERFRYWYFCKLP